ncbi:MAG TPA: AI-2E family transporter [Anaerolineae bacterium]|nr:AI-2E family transporter [Anaerolineae bacterium]
MTNQTSRHRWSSYTKLIVSLSMLAISLYLLYRFRAVIAPLVIAAILAFLLNPIVTFLVSKLRIRRGWATAIVYIVLIGLLSLLPILLVPELVDQITRLGSNFESIIQDVEGFLGREISIGSYVINVAQIIENLIEAFRGLMEPLFGQTLGIAVDVITSMVWFIFIMVISFYLVKDSPRMNERLIEITPPHYREDVRYLRSEINAIWAAFFRGQLTLAFVVAIIFSIVGLIIGLPFFLAMAVFAGLLEFLPSVGHAIWLILASLLMLFQGSTWIPIHNFVIMLILIGLHVVFQQIDLNYLIPRIVGRRVHLNPLVVILGIVAGAALAGVLGVLLAAPTIATARVLGGYLLANIFDMDPLPSSETVEDSDQPKATEAS